MNALYISQKLGSDFSIRLIGGQNVNEGTVQVTYQGQVGVICDDSWDNNDARVVCRMLGYE